MDKKRFVICLLAGVLVIVAIGSYLTYSKGPADAELPAESSATEQTDAKHGPTVPADYDMQQQIDYYTKLIAKADKDAWSYYQRGLVYQKGQQYRAAIQDYTRVLNIDPESANAYASRAMAYAEEGMPENAINDYAAALNIRPDANTYNSRGLLYVEQKQYDAALADYNKAIELNPKFDRAYFNLGTLYERQKQLSEALTAYSNAILNNLADDNTESAVLAAKMRLEEAYIRRAIVKLGLADVEGAMSDVNLAIDLNSKNPKSYRLRAAIYSQMGNTAESANDESTAQNLGLENLLEAK